MRPLRIRAEGFAAYRSPVEVRLEGVEFFSISGATGSGKSSLIDAMIFALYGRVPKLGARAVAPAITAGANRARVAFDFEVGGEAYVAVRQAERTRSGGASVTEARLQKGEKVLADGAKDVTAAVEELLHLRFEDFTRTVVLPQGEFARFLTADQAERQALLRNLLGLDVYAMVRQLARTRESVAKDRAQVARARLEGLVLADEVTVRATTERLAGLETLASSIVDSERGLAGLGETVKRRRDDLSRSEDAVQRLRRIDPPEHFTELDAVVDGATETLERAREATKGAEAMVDAAERRVAALPNADLIRLRRESHGRRAEAIERLRSLGEADAASRVASLSATLTSAREELDEVSESLETARAAHAAHAVADRLVVGEPCPVCTRVVEERPERTSPAELEDTEQRLAQGKARVEEAASQLENAKLELAEVETRKAEIDRQLVEIEKELEDAPDLDGLDEQERELAEAVAALGKAQATREKAREDTKTAERALEEVSEAVRSVGRAIMAARQGVADLEPPLPESDDPIIQWKEMLEWRDATITSLQEGMSGVTAALEEAEREEREARQAMVSRLEEMGVAAVEPYAVGVTRELQVVKGVAAEQEKALEESKSLATQIAISSDEAAVAGSLAAHLKADGFERWLMSGAIADLVVGANDLLAQLSHGGYSLHSDEEGAFSIIDHRNADERRPVSTLSGGETFLVSLALALSLAETLATAGGAELDTIILDEGFGTLDTETLDTVASVLEELAGEGLTVGVITHVKDLAARAPARLEVARGPKGSTVEMSA